MSFEFPAPFFDSYTLHGGGDHRHQPDPSGARGIQFKVLAKPLANVFRVRGSQVRHRVERCIMKLVEKSADGGTGELRESPLDAGAEALSTDGPGECRLVIEIAQQAGVRKTYKLFYWDCEALHAQYDYTKCQNMWVASPRVISDWISHFQRKLEEVTMRLGSRSVKLCSWSSFEVAGGEGLFGRNAHERHPRGSVASKTKAGDATRALHTEMDISVDEFDTFEVSPRAPITDDAQSAGSAVERDMIELGFSLHEFKSILLYAEAMAAPVEAYFDRGGAPIIFRVSCMQEPLVQPGNTRVQEGSAQITAQLILSTTSSGDTQAAGTETH
ncbi:hypothetical protein EV182_006366, partial [Spiromyces aspiralis]